MEINFEFRCAACGAFVRTRSLVGHVRLEELCCKPCARLDAGAEKEE